MQDSRPSVPKVPCGELALSGRRCAGNLLCERCQCIAALRALLIECLPSIEHHANKRRKGVEKGRRLGTPHRNAELRLDYLESLMRRIRSETVTKPEDSFYLVPQSMMEQVYRALSDYANPATYRPQRTGGVLQGCPRGPEPTPQQLTLGAELLLRQINRDLLGRDVKSR